MMKKILPSHTLVPMPKRSTKLLTLELDLDTLAEFSAAAEIFGARSKSTFLNQYVVQKIREAKELASREEFSAKVEKHKQLILERSERKLKERTGIKDGVIFRPDITFEEIPVSGKVNEESAKPDKKKAS